MASASEPYIVSGRLPNDGTSAVSTKSKTTDGALTDVLINIVLDIRFFYCRGVRTGTETEFSGQFV